MLNRLQKYHSAQQLVQDGVTLSATELSTSSDSTTILFILTGPNRLAVISLTDPTVQIDKEAVQNIATVQFDPIYDVSNSLLADSSSTPSITGLDVVFSPDGTKMFVLPGGPTQEQKDLYGLIGIFDCFDTLIVCAYVI